MGRRLGIALGLLVAVFAIGYGIYSQVFADKATVAPSFPDAAPLQPPDAAPKLLPVAQQVVVVTVTGRLERKADDGEWETLAVGDSVGVNDALRTIGDEASAVLEIGKGGTMVELSGEFTVPTLSTKLSTVQVLDGKIAANVAAGDARFRVEARGSDAVAETQDGSFSVLSTGEGDVAVASSRGKVAVSAAGQTVDVNEGEQSIVIGGGPPSPPEKLPTALLLKVGKTARQLRVRETIVRGTTTPGAIVSVGGIRVQANERGEFQTKVALNEGRNRLTLVVEDAFGRREKQKLPAFTVDTKPPESETGVEW